MRKVTHKIADNLHLVMQYADVPGQTAERVAAPTPAGTNHIAIIDCSYSMSGDLPRIRAQLKRRIPQLMGEQDTLSVIWFASAGQHGVLLDHEPVATLTDLKAVNTAIDRWLKPVGMTGFVGPLEDTWILITSGVKNGRSKGNPYAMFFMSDGHDNQSRNRNDILESLSRLRGDVGSATIVEYGYYADRPFLARMAAKIGGSHVFAQSFDDYAPKFEAAVQKKGSVAHAINTPIHDTAIGGFAFTAGGKEIRSFEIGPFEPASGAHPQVASIPSDLQMLAYLATGPFPGDYTVGPELISLSHVAAEHAARDMAYAAMSLFALRAKPDIVYPILRAVGDVRFIDQFANCFGKQAYTEFMEATQEATFGIGRYLEGWDPSRVPPDDAFTITDLLRALSADPANRLMLDHKDFSYNRIGRKAAQENTKLKFKARKPRRGYPVSGLVFNQKRPNVSVRVLREGMVDLKNSRPKNVKPLVPKRFPTQQFRNYAIVKDGLVNVEKLPVSLSAATFKQLRNEGVVSDKRKPAISVLDLSKLPVINRKMVKTCSALSLFNHTYRLQTAKAAQKVWNHAMAVHFPDAKKKSFEDQYGKEATDWLSDHGFKDYGYNPKTVNTKARDFYMGKELKVAISGLMSLPKVEDVIKRVKENAKAKRKHEAPPHKITPSMELMIRPLIEVESFQRGKAYREAPDQPRLFRDWLSQKQEHATAHTRQLMGQISDIVMSVIVGQVWFSDMATINDTTMEISFNGVPTNCSVTMVEKKVAI